MTTLALDTCFNACSVALAFEDAKGQARVCSERVLMRQGHAEALLPMVERVVARSGIAVAGIARIAVTHGPGTFTGVRSGLAAARGLALALGVPAIGFSSLLPIGLAAGGNVVVAADAGRGRLFVQVVADAVGGAGADPAPPELLAWAEAAALASTHALPVIGSGARAMLDAGFDIRIAAGDEDPDARLLLEIARHAPLPTAPPKPLYLREPDAKPQDGKAIARRS